MNLKFGEQNTRLEKAFCGNLSSPCTRVEGAAGGWGIYPHCAGGGGGRRLGCCLVSSFPFCCCDNMQWQKHLKVFSGPRFRRGRCPQAGNTWQQEQETAWSCCTTEKEQEVATAIKPQSPCLQWATSSSKTPPPKGVSTFSNRGTHLGHHILKSHHRKAGLSSVCKELGHGASLLRVLFSFEPMHPAVTLNAAAVILLFY